MRMLNKHLVETHILAALLCILFVLVSCRKEASFWQDKLTDKIEEMDTMNEIKTQNQVNAVIEHFEKVEEENQEDPDVQDIARVLYYLNDYNLSNKAKLAVVDIILNRVDCSYGNFGDTIHEVCSMPGQFAYSESGKYMYDDYHLVYEYLNGDASESYVPEGYYWLVVEYEMVTARDSFSKTKSTSYWVVK